MDRLTELPHELPDAPVWYGEPEATAWECGWEAGYRAALVVAREEVDQLRTRVDELKAEAEFWATK